MNAYNRAYHAVPGSLWEQLHRLYAFAESAGATDTPVAESSDGKSTVNLAYLQIVLTQRANPDSLSLLQMNTIDRALAQWVPLGGISITPVATDANVALGVDLGSAEGARRLKNLKGDNLRYLDLEKIGDKLRQTAVALKNQSPDKLGLGPVPREVCEKLMLSLHSHWLAPGTGRVDERKAVSFNVLVSGTLAAMHYNISGKPFSPPDAGLNSRARFEMAGFERVDGPGVGEASMRSRTLETWTVANQSASGILGMCRKPTDSTRLTHNQLLGLVAPNGNTYLGFVQRLTVDTEGMTWLGFRLLRSKAQAVAARVADNQIPYDRALLLAGVPAQGVVGAIVVWADLNPATVQLHFVLSMVLYPYVFLTARASFIRQPATQLEVARALGRSPWGAFRTVALPLARPGIAVGVSLALMECLNDIGAAGFFGVRTLTLGVYTTWLSQGNLGGAAQISAVMLLFNFVLLWIERGVRMKQAYAMPAQRARKTLRFTLTGCGVRGVLAVKDCFSAFRTGTLDHHGEYYNLDFITPQWNPGPIDAPDPKVDVAAVNPWMLRMGGEVADGVHVHPIGEPGYLRRHVLPNSLTPVVTFLPFRMSAAILSLTSLDFLGLGVPPGTPSLGELLAQGKNNIDAWWISLSTFAVLVVTLMLLTFMGDALRDALDPRKART